MTDARQLPEAVKKIVVAMVDRAIAECARRGITLEEFYEVMTEEAKKRPRCDTAALLTATLARFKVRDQ